MKKNNFWFEMSFIFVYCTLFNLQFAFSQSKQTEGPISISVIVERGEDKNLRGATAKLFEKANLVNTITTTADGEVNFKLNVNSEYTIEISNDGYVSKIIYINTKIPNYEKATFEVAFPLLLFVPCEGVDLTILQSPVVKLVYNEQKRDFLPEKDYDRVMLDKLQQLMKHNDDCIEEKYNSIVRKADRSFAEKKYTDALDSYNKALKMKPEDQYVIDKISEINKILSTQKTNDKLYNDYISQADAQFNNKRYALAKEFYKRALNLKPNSEYPTSQIKIIDNLLAKKSKEEQDKMEQDSKYQQLMTQGDDAFADDPCGKALQSYKDALVAKPNDAAAQQKINETDNKCKEIQEKDAQNKNIQDNYNSKLAEADKLFKAANYTEAKKAYQAAMAIIPGNDYPKNQIGVIDDNVKKQTKEKEATLKAKDKETEQQYKAYIKQGDKSFDNEDFVTAKDQFQKALGLKPGEIYPTDKIKTIDNILAEQQRNDADKKAKQDLFNKTIAEADQAMKKQDYTTAKTDYQKALQILPAESYPKQKLAEIDGIFKDQSDKNDHDYNLKIQSGDKNFVLKNYSQSKQDYKDALTIKPGSDYPAKRIDDIDKLLSEQARLEAEKKAKRDAYNTAIAKADNLLKSQQYDQAIISYKEASSYLPDEQYPYSKIDEINKIKKQNELENNYKQAITTADGYFQKKQFEPAKSAYNKALEYKANDKYALDQISKANKEISDQLKKLANQKARQDAYDKAIADADKYYNLKDFDMAKTSYQTAQAIFADKTYPKQQIDAIDKILNQQAKDKNYQSLIDDASELLANKNYENARAKYKEAGLVKPQETLPPDKIKEIDKILASNEADKQKQLLNEKNYNDELTKANELYDKAQYDAAKKEYEKALTFMPDETFPKQRIAKINEIKGLLTKSNKPSVVVPVKPTPVGISKLTDLKFQSKSEREQYLKELLAKYPAGITCEIYKEKSRTITRYVVIRENEANDFREIKYNWGGIDYMRNDKPITQLYFNTQIKVREGEYYTQTEM